MVANRRYAKPRRQKFKSLISPDSSTGPLPPYDFWAIQGHCEAQEWYAADLAERQGLEAADFAVLVPLSSVPPGTTIKKVRRVYERKASGLAKARLVVKDFRSPDVATPFAPVAADDSFKVLCALAASEDLDLHQLDIVRAFTLPSLPDSSEEYISLPPGWYPAELSSTHVLKLKKSLYGLLST